MTVSQADAIAERILPIALIGMDAMPTEDRRWIKMTLSHTVLEGAIAQLKEICNHTTTTATE